MPEKIRNIAARIRELRAIAGISPEALALELNVPLDTYLEYESGEADIPVGFLFKAAQRFNVELTDLLTGESPKLHIYALTRKGTGISVERRKQYKYQNLAYNFIHKKAEAFLVTVDPGVAGTFRADSHPGQEFNYVLDGAMKVTIDGHELILEEGDSLYFDAGFRHGMEALNNKPARFLAIII